MLNTIKEFFKYWNTDAALRYLPIVEHLRNGSLTNAKILEVGSGDHGITPYFRRRVVGVDISFKQKSQFLKQVYGRATDLPFSDKEFDVVMSVDMLEHLPKELRQKAVSEMLRVAKREVILAVPVGKKLDEAVKIYARAFEKKHGMLDQWLKDHVENPSPEKEEILSYIEKAAETQHLPITIKIRKNVNLKLWLLLCLSRVSRNIFRNILSKVAILFYPILKFINWGECVRLIFYIYVCRSSVDERIDPMRVSDSVTKYEHLLRYEYAAKRVRGKILDFGCGFGYGTKMLLKEDREVIGVDISKEAIDYAKKNYPGPKYLEIFENKIPFPNDYFDAVIAFEVIEHVKDPELLLLEIKRVMKKGAKLYISTPNPRHFSNRIRFILRGCKWPDKADEENIYHIREYPFFQFVLLLNRSGFQVNHCFGQTFISPKDLKKLLGLGRSSLTAPQEVSSSSFKRLLCKLIVLSGYFFPKLSYIMVAEARKM